MKYHLLVSNLNDLYMHLPSVTSWSNPGSHEYLSLQGHFRQFPSCDSQRFVWSMDAPEILSVDLSHDASQGRVVFTTLWLPSGAACISARPSLQLFSTTVGWGSTQGI
ncbi:hypothetical protein LIA77_00353 [Sarocladium implicatum]|nr:hypothetical protein LIA77_00353 [Sarocladium implicatum]